MDDRDLPYSGFLLKKVAVAQVISTTYSWCRFPAKLEYRKEGAAIIWGENEATEIQNFEWGCSACLLPWSGVEEDVKELQIFNGDELVVIGVPIKEAEVWLQLLLLLLRGIPRDPAQALPIPCLRLSLGQLISAEGEGKKLPPNLYIRIRFDDRVAYSCLRDKICTDFSKDPDIIFHNERPMGWSPNREVKLSLHKHREAGKHLGKVYVPLFSSQELPLRRLEIWTTSSETIKPVAYMDGLSLNLHVDKWWRSVSERTPLDLSINSISEFQELVTPILLRITSVIVYWRPVSAAYSRIERWEDKNRTLAVLVAVFFWVLFVPEYTPMLVCFVLAALMYAGSRGMLEPVHVAKEETEAEHENRIYEHQRRIGLSSFSSSFLIPTDPKPWTDKDRKAVDPPDGTWTVLVTENSDANGFRYGPAFNSDADQWSSEMSTVRGRVLGFSKVKAHWVRRRVWVQHDVTHDNVSVVVAHGVSDSQKSPPRVTSPVQDDNPHTLKILPQLRKYKVTVQNVVSAFDSILEQIEKRRWLFEQHKMHSSNVPWAQPVAIAALTGIGVACMLIPFRFLVLVFIGLKFQYGYWEGKKIIELSDTVIKDLSELAGHDITEDDIKSNWVLQHINATYVLTWDLRTLQSFGSVREVTKAVVDKSEKFRSLLFPAGRHPGLSKVKNFFDQIPSDVNKYKPSCSACVRPVPTVSKMLAK